MSSDDAHRLVSMTRTAPSTFLARNGRGGTLEVGAGDDPTFSPVELLLVAIGACTGIDVDILTSRRASPAAFEVVVEADKVRDEQGNHLTDIEVSFTVTFPAGSAGDAAREVLPDAVRRSHERLCTVSRTVMLPTPLTAGIRAGR